MLLVTRGTKGCSQGTYCFGTFTSVRFATSCPTPYSHHSYLYLFLLWSVTNGTSRGGYCTLSIVVVVNPSLHNNPWATYIIVIKTLEKPSLSLLLCLFSSFWPCVFHIWKLSLFFFCFYMGQIEQKKTKCWVFSDCLASVFRTTGPRKGGKTL